MSSGLHREATQLLPEIDSFCAVLLVHFSFTDLVSVKLSPHTSAYVGGVCVDAVYL